MRSGHANSKGGYYHDRNPLTVYRTYDAAGVVPHAEASFGSYVIPANRRALLQEFSVSILRDGAANAQGEVWARLFVIPAAGGTYGVAHWRMMGIALWNYSQVVTPFNLLFQPGDIILHTTLDGCTGGTLAWKVSVRYTEFDA